MAENILLPSYTGTTALTNLGVYALSILTTEEMFWAWQDGINDNVFVEFDGNTYECAPQRLAAMDNGMAVGNCTAFGGTGNNEPFIVTIMPDTDQNGNATGAYYWAVAALTDTASTEHTVEVYQVEASAAFAVVLKDRSGANVTYEVPSEQIKLNTPNGTQIFTAGQAVENVPITLDLADGDQTVNAPEGTLVKSAIIQKPSTLTPDNIVKDVNIAGVVGTFEGGGGGGGDEELVNFYDYDGTLLYSYTISQANALTALPELPTQEGLICQGWNYTLEGVQNTTRELTVGATYITDDGKTRVHFVVGANGNTMSFNYKQTVANGVTIDWGDGSAPQTSSTAGSVILVNHTYSVAGEYVVSFEVADGCTCTLGDDTNANNYFIKNTTSILNAVKKIHVGARSILAPVNAFRSLNFLKSITIPNGITSVGTNGFYQCDSLECVIFPRGCTTIGDYVCDTYCRSLNTVSIPNTVTNIGIYAFNQNTQLKNINIPDSVTSIGSRAFYQTGIEKIDFPDGMTTIPDYCCSNCTNLKKVVIPDSVTSIGQSAFNYCIAMYNLSPLNGVVTIGYNGFTNCWSLPKIVFSSNLNSIGNYAFQYCKSLQSIVLPDSLTSIGTYAFSYCYSLKYVVLPNSLTIIPQYMFYYCYSLQPFAIPNTITNIETTAFYACGALTFDFSHFTAVPALASYSAFSTSNPLTIIVPAALYSTWIASAPWSNTNLKKYIVAAQ